MEIFLEANDRTENEILSIINDNVFNPLEFQVIKEPKININNDKPIVMPETWYKLNDNVSILFNLLGNGKFPFDYDQSKSRTKTLTLSNDVHLSEITLLFNVSSGGDGVWIDSVDLNQNEITIFYQIHKGKSFSTMAMSTYVVQVFLKRINSDHPKIILKLTE